MASEEEIETRTVIGLGLFIALGVTAIGLMTVNLSGSASDSSPVAADSAKSGKSRPNIRAKDRLRQRTAQPVRPSAVDPARVREAVPAEGAGAPIRLRPPAPASPAPAGT
ncbi:MAG: hypothetical protein RJA70_3937 [Pseudomonadota bacterium]|jgi:hypothetical protein